MLVFINTRGEKYLFNCLETYISSLFLLALLCTAKSGFIPQSQSTTKKKGVVRNSVVVVVVVVSI